MSAQVQPASPLDRLMIVTFFKTKGAAEKQEARATLRMLEPKIANTSRDEKTMLPWLKLARFGNKRSDGNSLRNDKNVLGISGIEADYDHEIVSVDDALAIMRRARIAGMIYTSPSHTDDTPRWRILCPLSRDYDPAQRAGFLARLNGLFHGALARESFVLSQSYYFGSVKRSPSHRVELIEGDFIDAREDLEDGAVGVPQEEKTQRPAQTQAEPSENAGPYCAAVLKSALEKVRNAPDGSKHPTLRAQARVLGGFAEAAGWSRGNIVGQLIDALPKSVLDWDAARTTAEWGFDKGLTEPLEVPPPRDNVVHLRAPEPPPHDAIPDEPGPDDPRPPPVAGAPSKPTHQDGLPLVWFDDIEPALDAMDFVQGVLVQQSAAVVYGESNAGKTFWTTDLALHVAAGLEWNGKRVEQGGVIYCVLEGGRGFKNRVSAWRAKRGVSGIPFASIPAALNLLNPEADTQPLIDSIKKVSERITSSHGVSVSLVVIDTLSRAMAGGNENAPEDMGALVKNMDRIREETGACVLFVHHSGKDVAKGARGHSLLRAAVDTEIEVVAGDGDDKTATVVKQRELSKGDTFGFTLEVVTLGTNRHGEEVTTCIVKYVENAAPIARKPRKQSPNEALGLRALDHALDKAGAYLPALPEYPDHTFATTQEVWRQEFYHLHGDDKAAARLAFNRARASLLADETITQRGNFVWKSRENRK